MKQKLRLCVVGFVLGVWVCAQAVPPVISSFNRNGELICTNLPPGSAAGLEWAPSVSGPWTNNWAELEAVTAASNGMISVSLPMQSDQKLRFYRVAIRYPGLTKRFHVVQRVFRTPEDTLVITNANWIRFVLVTTLPASNPWQTVTDFRCSAGGVRQAPENGRAYFRLEQDFIPDTVLIEYDIVVPVPQADYVFAEGYDYRDGPAPVSLIRYTGTNGIIDPNHPFVVSNAPALAAQSSNNLDYCRHAYIYQQAHFNYQATHWNTLDQLIANGGGECANLSMLYCSLVRAHVLPTKYFTGRIWRDGVLSSHVWPAVYLVGLGWIPADPSHYHAGGGYFGKLTEGSYLALNEEDPLPIRINNGSAVVDIVLFSGVSHYQWYWRSGGTRTGTLKMDQDILVTATD